MGPRRRRRSGTGHCPTGVGNSKDCGTTESSSRVRESKFSDRGSRNLLFARKRLVRLTRLNRSCLPPRRFLVTHFGLRGWLSANARLDSCTIRWSSFSNANLSSGFCVSRRRLEVAKNSSCNSLNLSLHPQYKSARRGKNLTLHAKNRHPGLLRTAAVRRGASEMPSKN
jgi:hypothetical protein